MVILEYREVFFIYLILHKFFRFLFFFITPGAILIFKLTSFCPGKVLILSSYFYIFLTYNLSKIYINSDDRSIYFLFGIFVSCFILLVSGATCGVLNPRGPEREPSLGSSFYGEYKLILIFGLIIAFLLSSCFILLVSGATYGVWNLRGPEREPPLDQVFMVNINWSEYLFESLLAHCFFIL